MEQIETHLFLMSDNDYPCFKGYALKISMGVFLNRIINLSLMKVVHSFYRRNYKPIIEM